MNSGYTARLVRRLLMPTLARHPGRPFENLCVVVERACAVTRSVETVAEWVTLSATRCVRSVEELDQLRAREIDHAAEGLLRLRGPTALFQQRLCSSSTPESALSSS